MFEGMKDLNLGNLGDLMRKAQEMQQQMQRAQEELGKKIVTADAGAGMVQATVNGRMELVKLHIDKSKIDVNDTEMLEDVVIAAVNGAQKKAAEMMQEELKKATAGLGLPPGLLP